MPHAVILNNWCRFWLPNVQANEDVIQFFLEAEKDEH